MEANRRSDAVRARRSQRSSTSGKPRKDRKRRKSSERSMPPVYSRSGFAYPTATSVSTKTPARVRRKYNVSLDTEGAEVKLPAVPVVSIGWRVVSGLMTVGLLFALYWLWSSPMFTVTEVTLNGISRVDKGDLLARANIIGQPVFAIDPVALQENLRDGVRALEDITITVDYPAEVIFTATERHPVLIWEQAGVTSWWVDSNGVRFAPLGSSDDLVYVEAKAPPPEIFTQDSIEGPGGDEAAGRTDSEQLLLPEMVSGIMFLADYLPEGARMIFHERHGIGWEDPEMGWQVFFGKTLDKMPIRIALYQAISEELIARNRIPVMISIEQVAAPYYRMRN